MATGRAATDALAEQLRAEAEFAVPIPNPPLPAYIPPIPPIPPAPIITVQVRKLDYRWTVSCMKDGLPVELPAIPVLRQLMPKEYRKYLGKGTRHSSTYHLRNALDAGCPPIIVHDAIKAWAFAFFSPTNGPVESSEALVSSEDSFLLRAQPANLIVGGKVYRLVPTGESDIRPMIRQVRKRAIDLAATEANAIRFEARATAGNMRDNAQRDSRMVIRQAEDRAATIRGAIERERLNQSVKPPQWVIDHGVKCWYDSGRFQVGLYVSVKITGIRYRVSAWATTLWWNPLVGVSTEELRLHPLLLWVPIGPSGEYDFSSVHTDGYHVTHINNRSACMDLQGLPRAIDSIDKLAELKNAITRGMEVVNLNSPLSRELSKYYPLFKAQLPKAAIGLLDRNLTIPTGIASLVETRSTIDRDYRWDREETDQQELNQTFTAR